jgi:hypothetical protein
VRQVSKGAVVAVTATATEAGLTTRPSETSGTNADDEGVEPSRSDAAQQLSASAWLRTLVVSVPRSADACIGQVPPSRQHAIRSSGVLSHPAQRPEPPAEKKAISAAAAMRLVNISTRIGCVGRPVVSTGWPYLRGPATG